MELSWKSLKDIAPERHFPSKCAKTTVLLFQLKVPPETVPGRAGQALGSPRAGSQDYVSLSQGANSLKT